MKIKIILLLSTLCMLPVSLVHAGIEEATEEYIQKYKDIAIYEMKKYGIPASITLAQGLLESGTGTSRLATLGNNHFGIKCHEAWTGPTMKHTDDAVDECFRVYSDARQSYIDHSQFLISRPRYAFLFNLKTDDYKGWARGLKKAGYATNPRYAEMLISCIERNQLYVFDMDISPEQMQAYRSQLSELDLKELQTLQKQDSRIKTTTQVTIPTSKPTLINQPAGDVIFYNNRVKVIRLQNGETIQEVAKKMHLSVSQLRRYNDLKPKQEIPAGQLVYLGQKKKKHKQKNYLVLPNDDMWNISQMYGIRLNRLYEINLMRPGEEPISGTNLSLKKKLKQKPVIRSKNSKPETITIPLAQVENNLKNTNQTNTANDKTTLTSTEELSQSNASSEINLHPFNYEIGSQRTESISGNLPSDVIIHTVQDGDTLYNISKKYNVTIDEIKYWNKMTDNNIKLDQRLIILQ